MQSVYIKFYLTESQRHDSKLLYEWILEKAKQLGLPGGSVFRAVSGFGRHGHLHSDTFFELSGELPVQVEFVLSSVHAEKLIVAMNDEKLKLPYVCYAVEYGVTGN
jgi:PII-like signaling protein